MKHAIMILICALLAAACVSETEPVEEQQQATCAELCHGLDVQGAFACGKGPIVNTELCVSSCEQADLEQPDCWALVRAWSQCIYDLPDDVCLSTADPEPCQDHQRAGFECLYPDKEW